MKKLSEYRDGEALDIIADMLGPIVAMTKNTEFMAVINNDKATRLEMVQVALKVCQHEVIEMLAILNNVPVEEYHCSVASIMVDATSLFADKDFISFFESQSQKNSEDTFGSATGNIEAAAQ